MIHISEAQFNLVLKKYGNLLHKVCHNISGDPSKDYLDYYQEVVMELYPIVKTFDKKVKEGKVRGYETNTSALFEEYFTWKPFDQYFKTSIWNYKNRTGSKIPPKPDIETRLGKVYTCKNSDKILTYTGNKKAGEDTTSFDLYIPNSSSVDYDSDTFKKLYLKLTDREKSLVECIVNNPSKALCSNGRLNITSLSRVLKLESYEVKKVVASLSEKVNFVG